VSFNYSINQLTAISVNKVQAACRWRLQSWTAANRRIQMQFNWRSAIPDLRWTVPANRPAGKQSRQVHIGV